MAIIRRLNMLPFAPNISRNMPRKRKHCEVSPPPPPPSVETTSGSSSDDEEYNSDDYSESNNNNNNSSLLLLPTKRSVVVVSPTPGRVHFDLDPEQEDDEDDCPAPAADLDYLQEHKADLWYSKADRQEFQSEACDIIQWFKSEQPEQAAKFGALYSVKTNSNSDAESENKSQSPATTTVQLPLMMRGLEWGITPALKKKRQSHIRQVLLACDIANETQRERVIAARSRKSSRIARSVSQKVAQGKDVVFVQEEEGCSSSQDSDTPDTPSDESTIQETKEATTVSGLPPREPPTKRMRLWQR